MAGAEDCDFPELPSPEAEPIPEPPSPEAEAIPAIPEADVRCDYCGGLHDIVDCPEVVADLELEEEEKASDLKTMGVTWSDLE